MSSSTIVCGLNPTEDGELSVCKGWAPVSESFNLDISQCPSIHGTSKTNFPLHSALLLKRIEGTFYDHIALLNEPRNHVIHLAGSIIFVHNRLMLVHDQRNALEEGR